MGRYELMFQLVTMPILIPWALLAVAPGWKWTQRITGFLIPMLLCVAYFAVFIRQAPISHGGFGSLREVMDVFNEPLVALAGWIHYLAFDLFIGAWEVRDARRLGIRHLIVIPCLLLTLMFGPIGLGCYGVLRYATKREIEP